MGKDRAKKAIRLQRDILKSTSMLYSLGYRIETRYIKGAGWHSEIVDNNTGENHELDEHSEPTTDKYDEKNTWEHLDKFDNSHECESETTPIDDYIQGGNNE